jgi:LCP family protein required for cell wall assembly
MYQQPVMEPVRRKGSRLAPMLAVIVVVAAACAAGLLIATRRVSDSVTRVPGVAEVLSPANPNVENFLLVGSDSRAEGDPNTGDTGGVTNSRSDTMMILRTDPGSGSAALLSIPRDLYVLKSNGEEGRINGAFNDGPAALTQTIQSALGIPVHHYVEVDFVGFKDLVDALGGVKSCFLYPTRDLNTGLNIVEPGCYTLNGVESLSLTRSRYYEELRDGEWRKDGTADIGRTKRQQGFINTALQTALDRIKTDPLAAGKLTDAIGSALAVDAELDPISAASTLRTAMGGGLTTYSLPVVGDEVGDAQVLRLGDGADLVLSYFSGASSDAPPVTP